MNWTPEEDDFFILFYQEMPCTAIAESLGRSISSVENRRNKLLHEGKIKRKENNAGCFEKNFTPWNKGKKGYIGANRTSFKPGTIPANTKEYGTIYLRYEHKQRSGRQFYWIKTDQRKVMPLHRYLWQQHNGSIPKGHVVRFKDGNSLNCVIENLECISKRENMKRNTIHRYHGTDYYKATFALIGLKEAIHEQY